MKKVRVIPDGYLPEQSKVELLSHETVCVLNTEDVDANLVITVYFENREPPSGFTAICDGRIISDWIS